MKSTNKTKAQLQQEIDKLNERIVGLENAETLWKAKEDKRLEEDLFLRFADTAFEGIGIAVDGVIQEVNDRLIEMTSYSRKELIGQPFMKLIYPEDQTLVTDNIQKGENLHDLRVVKKDGSVLYVEIRATFITYQGREAWMAGLYDITERKITEKNILTVSNRLVNTLEDMTDGFVSLDTDWIYTYVNETAAKMFGRRPEELVGTHIWTEFPEGIDQPFYKNYYQAVETQKPVMFEDYYEPWDRYFENRVIPSKNGLSIFFQDITTRKHAAIKLGESEERYRNLVELSGDIIYTSDNEGNYMFLNDFALELLEVTSEEVIGKPWINTIHPDDRERSSMKFMEMVEKGIEVFNYENRFISKSGKEIHALHNIKILINKERDRVGSQGIARVINDLKLKEKKIKIQSKRNQLILDTTLEGYILADQKGKLIDVNGAYSNLIGYDKEELIGMQIQSIEAKLSPEEVKRRIERMVSKGTDRFETQHRHKSGRLLDLEVSVAIVEKNGDTHVNAFVRDITERKKSERAIQYRLDLEKLTTEFTKSFVGVDYDNFDSILNTALEKIARFSGATRSSIFHISLSSDTLNNTHEWCADPGDSQIEMLQNIPFSTFGWHKEQLMKGKVIAIAKPGDYPERARGEREWIAAHGFRALLFIPLVKNQALQGALGFYGEVGKKISWPQELKEMLNTLGTLITTTRERITAEHALKGSEERYKILFENSAVPIWVEDFSAVKERFNQLKEEGISDFETYFAQHPDEVAQLAGLVEVIDVNETSVAFYKAKDKKSLVKNLQSYFTADSLDVFGQELVTLADGKESFESEISITTPAGETLHLVVSLSVPNIYKDTLEQVLVSFLNVTDRKKAELALQDSESKFKSYIENAPNGIFVVDEKGNYVEANKSAEQITGYSRNELLMMNLMDITAAPDHQKAGENFKKLQATGKINQDLTFIKKDGSLNHWEVNAVKIADSQFLGFASDISERKKIEKELSDYRENLEELVENKTAKLRENTVALEKAVIRLQDMDQLKSIFLSSMSHELRTPLNSIIGFTGILLMGMTGELSEEQKKQLSKVKHNANHLLSLINDILDISKIEAEKAELYLEKFYLNEVVNDVVESLTPLSNDKDLKLSADLPADVAMLSDKRRLKQVLMNLVGNAIKFTEKGSVKITFTKLKPNLAKISVTDTGFGIKKEEIDQLFQPFQQIDSSYTKSHDGTGLGLYLCKKLMALLGGNISLNSEIGKGSEFTIVMQLKYNQKNK